MASKGPKQYKNVKFFREVIAQVKAWKEEERKPQAFAYARVSRAEQVEQGLSLPAQQDACRAFYERRLASEGIGWSGLFADEAVSAFSKRMANRPQAKKLLAQLRKGDHLIITRSDRAFRNLMDSCVMYDLLERQGVTVHCVDMPWDTSSASGRAMMQMMGVFAEWESRVKSDRVHAAFQIKRALGEHCSGSIPWCYTGFKNYRGRLALKVNPEQVQISEIALRGFQEAIGSGISVVRGIKKVVKFLNLAYPKGFRGKDWTYNRVKYILKSYDKYLARLNAAQNGIASGPLEDLQDKIHQNNPPLDVQAE